MKRAKKTAQPTSPARSNGKHPGGRPTKYHPDICKRIIKFFDIGLTHIETRREWNVKLQRTVERKVIVPNNMPFLSAFARKEGLDTKTLERWATPGGPDCREEFSRAYARAKELQKEILIQNTLNGNYNPQFAMFTAKNITDMRDIQAIEHTGKGGTPLIQISFDKADGRL